jgi:hypothetical protein
MKKYAVLFISSLLLLTAGCAQQTSLTTNTEPSKPSTTTSVSTSDSCGNPYYPFKSGLVIAYRVTPTTGAAGSSDYTIRILSVTGTTAATRAEFAGGVIADMTADCASGSVALKGSSGLSAAMQDVKFKTTVVSSSGTFMPADVKAGATWSNSETIIMELTGGPAASMGPITMTTTEESKAIGEESVTVPAGTYTAMKVELTRKTISKANFGTIPESTSTSTEWWVKGIGMVKTVTKTEDGTSTIEAKSITGL